MARRIAGRLEEQVDRLRGVEGVTVIAQQVESATDFGGAPGVDLTTREGRGLNRAERPAADVPAATKVEWLREVDDAARGFSPEVTQVVGVYGDSLQRRLIAASDGTRGTLVLPHYGGGANWEGGAAEVVTPRLPRSRGRPRAGGPGRPSARR